MKKIKLTPKNAVVCIAIVLLVLAILVVIHVNRTRDCHDIIGDGYAMGTDPEPVVIANSCDQ
jgi:hypothetical protein